MGIGVLGLGPLGPGVIFAAERVPGAPGGGVFGHRLLQQGEGFVGPAHQRQRDALALERADPRHRRGLDVLVVGQGCAVAPAREAEVGAEQGEARILDPGQERLIEHAARVEQALLVQRPLNLGDGGVAHPRRGLGGVTENGGF